MRQTLKILALLFIITITAFAASDQDRVFPGNWDLPTANIPESVFQWKPAQYPFENASLFVLGRLDDGAVLLINFFTFRAPIGQRWGLTATLTDSAGQRHFYKMEVPEKDVELRPGSAYIRLGKSIFDGKAPNYKMHFEVEGFVADLSFQNMVPTWKPGNGVTYYTEDKKVFYENSVVLPFARLSGKITYNGKTIEATGWAYGDRAHSNLSFFNQNESIFAIRGFPKNPDAPKFAMSMLEYKANKAYGSLRIPWIIIESDKKYIVATKNYTITPSDFRKDPNTGYTYPWRLEVSGQDHGVSFKFLSQAQALKETLDVINELPAYLRPLAKKFFARPVFYRYTGTLTGVITLADGTKIPLDLSGYSEVTFIQKN